MIALKVKLEQDLQANFWRRSASAQRLLNALFIQPAISIEEVQKICDTSSKLLMN